MTWVVETLGWESVIRDNVTFYDHAFLILRHKVARKRIVMSWREVNRLGICAGDSVHLKGHCVLRVQSTLFRKVRRVF